MPLAPIPIALVGIGKIARDQHLPAIAGSGDFTLVGAVSHGPVEFDVPVFGTLEELKAAVPAATAVSLCTPPAGRLALVRTALSLGYDVMIEKPPAATLSEAEHMVDLSAAAGRTLFAAWHSREAAGVEAARGWLATRTLLSARIRWLEDVRVWHPGQEWIWEPGIGVFDPGINALSILTRIVGAPLTVVTSALEMPRNRRAPIAATLTLADDGGAPVDVAFSFDQRGPQTWTMEVDTDGGSLVLTDGGANLSIDGAPQALSSPGEYPRLYARFARLIAAGQSDLDLTPFRLVADSFLRAETRQIADFEWNS